MITIILLHIAPSPLYSVHLSTHRSANDWNFVGNITCITGESECIAAEDLSDKVQRSDAIAIAGETHVVRIKLATTP